MKLFLWKISAVSLSFSAGADMNSSRGGLEANPILAQHGQFTGRSVGIDSAITGVVLGGEWLLLRRHPKSQRVVAVGNFIGTGVHLGAFVHNERIR